MRHPKLNASQKGKAIGAAALLISGGTGVWYFSSTSAEQPLDAVAVKVRPPSSVLRRERSERISRFSLVEVSSPEWRGQFEMALGEALAKSTAIAGLRLDDDQRLKYLRAIADMIAARSSSSSETVALQLESRPGRWLRPDEDEKTWRSVALGVEELSGMPVRREDARGAFVLLDGHARTKGSAAVRAVAAEFGAIHLRVGRSASRDAIEDPGFDVLEQRDLWNGFATMVSPRLRIAEPTLDDVLASSRLVTYVHSWITLESTGGERYVWRSIWHWDPKGKDWVHHVSFVQGDGSQGWYH